MKIQLMLTAAAAVLLGGCTTAYETRSYHDTGGYYAGRDRDYYDGGYYGRSYHDDGSGNYDRDHYNQTNVREVHTNAVVVHERGATGSHATAGHAVAGHQTSATVSHGRSGGNKAAVGSSTKPAKVPSAGKHPRSDKTSKPEKKTD
jgi:hypothetical protein